jgi:hypothetical protein
MKVSYDRIQFYVTFPSVPVPVEKVWNILSGYLQQCGSLPEQFEVSQLAGHSPKHKGEDDIRLNAAQIEKLIRDRDLDGFTITSGRMPRSLDFWLFHAKEMGRQSVLHSMIERLAQAPDDWGVMRESMMKAFPTTGAWQWRGLYRSWQGAECLETGYERRYGKLPTGCKTRKEPSPDGYGEGKTMIDISLNPGRPKELYHFSHFYPTAEMWLGPHFWQYAKCTKEEALAADFWLETRETAHFSYFRCWPTAFTRPDGEQGRMQRRLWKLFFHEDCEWPPGSGSICDEPMYGPAELMPS